MAPPPVSIDSGRLSVTALEEEVTLSLVVWIERVPAPPTATAPAPFCANAPSALISPLRLSVPALVRLRCRRRSS